MRTIGVIGTAGRSCKERLTRDLWQAMTEDFMTQLSFFNQEAICLVSGGAAWADHLAVWAYRCRLVNCLSLHLPAPLPRSTYGSRYQGSHGSAGNVSNYYHDLFTRITGVQSFQQLTEAVNSGCALTQQPSDTGLGAFFARNKLVAAEALDGLIAYTWDQVPFQPTGGTGHTWALSRASVKVHRRLQELCPCANIQATSG